MVPLFSLLDRDAMRAALLTVMVTAVLASSSADAFAWPEKIGRVLPAGEQVPVPRTRAALGVTLGEGSAQGIEVAGVMPNSPAAEAGVRPGDLLWGIDGRPVTSSRDVIRLVAAHEPDDRIRLQVDRKGLRGTLRATLASQRDVTRRAALGVTLSKSAHGGVRILQVVSGSPADKAGLKIGDRIQAIDDQPVASYSDLVRLIGESRPGSDMKIDVDRYGLEGTLHASLTGRSQVFSAPRPVAAVPAAPAPRPVFELTPSDIDDQRGYGD
jgi:S1-C subfamily serine protease